MDERDWTSLESSSESSVECSADEEMMVSPKEQEFEKHVRNEVSFWEKRNRDK